MGCFLLRRVMAILLKGNLVHSSKISLAVIPITSYIYNYVIYLVSYICVLYSLPFFFLSFFLSFLLLSFYLVFFLYLPSY